MRFSQRSLTLFSVMVTAATLLFILPTRSMAQRVYNKNAPILPDSRLTPGDVLAVTAQDICVAGYTKKVRSVPNAVKEQVYRSYGITKHGKGEYEVDHLISLELGGSNSVKNLWPQSYLTKPWNAHVKDKLENELHREVCAGTIDIKTAQREIATDWIAAYKRHFNTQTPLAGRTADARRRTTARKRTVATRTRNMVKRLTKRKRISESPIGIAVTGQVWVNTDSGKYWRPGTRYYGKTRQGKYMREADAIQAGYLLEGK